MQDLLFSPNGRIGRAGFWKGALILFGVAIVVGIVAFGLSRIIPGQPTTDGSYKVSGLAAIPYFALVFGYIALSFWSGICLGIKRYHDRGKSGAWIPSSSCPSSARSGISSRPAAWRGHPGQTPMASAPTLARRDWPTALPLYSRATSAVADVRHAKNLEQGQRIGIAKLFRIDAPRSRLPLTHI